MLLHAARLPKQKQNTGSNQALAIPELRSSEMHIHTIIMFVITTLGLSLQLKFHSQPYSPFETNYWTMVSFLLTLLTYVVLWAAVSSSTTQDVASDQYNAWLMRKLSIMSGSLSSIFLLLALISVLRCIALILWILYLAKSVYELVYHEEVRIDTLSKKTKEILSIQSENDKEWTRWSLCFLMSISYCCCCC